MVLMTCSSSYCLGDTMRTHGIYAYIYTCMYVGIYVCMAYYDTFVVFV
jgi:hypothetical protein